ncbi:uncharacterized protein LOC114515993 [Dendronephthya gigantea]|uniref:uncharacterized protein LOC114515993 n=1 Tax=Dendronephthya gigantea TaxID=151771 RepID=UPI00106BB2A5|nr:uncharacterized protein LOC114515993 [Dendronephthya gigantea]
MELLWLFLIVAISAISSVECGCDSERRTITSADNSNLVLCIQFKNSDCLHCKANGNYAKCDTKRAQTNDPADKYGPAPNGRYAIGSVYKHSKHGISWANLYPKKQHNNGWWDYYRSNPDVPGSRSHIGLHPGRLSQGCVTVTDKSCWNKVETMLQSKNGAHITVSRTWFRIAIVKCVGVLRVMN